MIHTQPVQRGHMKLCFCSAPASCTALLTHTTLTFLYSNSTVNSCSTNNTHTVDLNIVTVVSCVEDMWPVCGVFFYYLRGGDFIIITQSITDVFSVAMSDLFIIQSYCSSSVLARCVSCHPTPTHTNNTTITFVLIAVFHNLHIK